MCGRGQRTLSLPPRRTHFNGENGRMGSYQVRRLGADRACLLSGLQCTQIAHDDRSLQVAAARAGAPTQVHTLTRRELPITNSPAAHVA